MTVGERALDPPLLLRNVEVEGVATDVLLEHGRIAAIDPRLVARQGAEEVDGLGGALIPGLHDHHIHLLATAAAARSVTCGPPAVQNRDELVDALRAADRALPPDRWMRAVGYHESIAGDLDRSDIDRIVHQRPVRLQHRSGARWTLNSAALSALSIADRTDPGIERDAGGEPTGRLHRADFWLRALLPRDEAPDLAALGTRLARFGVTGVTDMTPYETADDLAAITDAVRSCALPQRVMVTGGPALAGAAFPVELERGPVKLLIDDGDYPSLELLTDQIAAAHEHERSVAIHCVTQTSLVLALAAWDVVGARAGDRVEHGSVIPPELIEAMRRHRLTVVTQPGFVAERGDEYLRDVAPDDRPHLYRCRSLIEAGLPVAGSTDSPYSSPDPWLAMRAAVSRRSLAGATIGELERIDPAQALCLFLGDLADPGGPPRQVSVGAPADLCLLGQPLAETLDRLDSGVVVATIRAGRVVHRT
ncbi:MAG: amidohydrolase [Actinomycetota bacterium]